MHGPGMLGAVHNRSAQPLARGIPRQRTYADRSKHFPPCHFAIPSGSCPDSDSMPLLPPDLEAVSRRMVGLEVHSSCDGRLETLGFDLAHAHPGEIRSVPADETGIYCQCKSDSRCQEGNKHASTLSSCMAQHISVLGHYCLCPNRTRNPDGFSNGLERG